MAIYFSTKTYTHAQGLSCCFRQWRATHSHCQFLHGYAIQVRIEFASESLDSRNWVVDFGGMKEIKQWLADTFDHKTLVAVDDPMRAQLLELNKLKLASVVIVDNTGCEAFAELIYQKAASWLSRVTDGRKIWVHRVTVEEHAGNSASYCPYTTTKVPEHVKG